MDFVRGLVVRALAGRDKGGFFTVLEASDDMAVICNGKRRSLEHPKRKKQKHLLITKTILWKRVHCKPTVKFAMPFVHLKGRAVFRKRRLQYVETGRN